MNILIFNWRDLKHSWAGGGEIYVFELAKRWVKMGHKVTVFCGNDSYSKLSEEDFYSGIKIYRKGGRFSLYLWAPIIYLKKLRKEVDLVIDVENGIPFFTPLFCFKPKVAFVYHVHGKQFFYELFFPFNYIGYFIEKYIFKTLYSKIPIIAISETTKKELLKLGFKKKNITIVYPGISGKLRDIKKIKKFAHPTILYLGRIKAYKRVDVLIKILPTLLSDIPNLKLLIAGWGTDASSLTDRVMRSAYRKKIKIIGPVSEGEKRTLLSKAWVFANPSIGEGWGISIIEANLNGSPAVGFNVPGLSESIRHMETGILAKNEDDFVDSIKMLIKDNRLREKMSRNAFNWSKQFNWDNAARESAGVLEKIIK